MPAKFRPSSNISVESRAGEEKGNEASFRFFPSPVEAMVIFLPVAAMLQHNDGAVRGEIESGWRRRWTVGEHVLLLPLFFSPFLFLLLPVSLSSLLLLLHLFFGLKDL